MYFRGVNRGLSFTKAGFYATGLVFFIGFLATSSASNGLFLGLGFGLSFLVISGILSEKMMLACELNQIETVRSEPGQPFTVKLGFENTHRRWHLIGIESLGFFQLPRFRTLPSEWKGILEARLLALPPRTSAVIEGTCTPLPRGRIREMLVVQSTLFPFGMIKKFKVSRVAADIQIVPKLDEAFLSELSSELNALWATRRDEFEFHSHRTWTIHDPSKHVDWKKSASRESEAWLVKSYLAPASDFGICLVIEGDPRAQVQTAQDYEDLLSRYRAVVDVASRQQRRILIRVQGVGFCVDKETSMTWLASLPKFKSETIKSGAKYSAPTLWTQAGMSLVEEPPPGWYLEISVTLTTHTWSKQVVHLPAERR